MPEITRNRVKSLGFVQMNTSHTGIGTALTDITGLGGLTFTIPTDPVWVELWVPSLKQNTSAGIILLYISTSANDAVAYMQHDATAGATIGPGFVKRRLTSATTGWTPGASITLKGRAITTVGTVDVRANTDTIPVVNGPAYLTAYKE